MIGYMHPTFSSMLLGLAWVVSASAVAASTVRLPAATCPASETLFRDGWETRAVPHVPSNGSGGTFPGNVTRTIAVPALGNRVSYLHLPPNYSPAQSWPLLLALRGSTFASQADEEAAAQQVRSDWSGRADSAGFIVISVAGTSTYGGWGAVNDIAELNAALDDVFARYNIEESRVYLWGFSAGAHYAHALALGSPDFFAAYGVSAGSLEQYACSDHGQFLPSCTALLGSTQPRIPVDIHLGLSDPLYLDYGAGADVTRFENAGWVRNQDLFYTPFAGGHTYTVAQLGEIWNNLCPFALGP